MEERSPATMERIQQAALEEFSEKGFLGASLRQIVKNAGVTTGAFYGYFSSKEALFASLVEPHAAALMGRFMEAQTSFADLAEEEQPKHMGEASGDYVDWMVDYICQAPRAGKAAALPGGGDFLRAFCPQYGGNRSGVYPQIHGGASPPGEGHPRPEPLSLPHHCQRHVQRTLRDCGARYAREQARLYVAQFRAFYTAGWLKLMGQ